MKCCECKIDITEGSLCETCLKKPLNPKSESSAIDHLNALRNKLISIVMDVDASADVLRKEVDSSLPELDKCVALLQIEGFFNKPSDTGAEFVRELHRTTSQPLPPPDKKADPHRIDFGF